MGKEAIIARSNFKATALFPMIFQKAKQAKDIKSNICITLVDGFNPLPNVKFLDWSKFKAFADDKINVT